MLEENFNSFYSFGSSFILWGTDNVNGGSSVFFSLKIFLSLESHKQ